MMHAYINNEYKSFTMFALDLKRGMFSSHLKKKKFELLSFAMFKYSNDYLNLKYKQKRKTEPSQP